MTYVVVTERKKVIGVPYSSYSSALEAAIKQFGDDVSNWLTLNLRIEENR